MSAESEGRQAAAKFRDRHHLGIQPLGDLVALIEQTTGIDVAVLDVGPDEHGLTMRDPARDAVMIAVARTRNPMRQRSTLAHELAHVIFEDWLEQPILTSSSHEESRANAFARHLLIPVDGLKEVVGSGPADRGTLSKVVQLFEVSPAIAAIVLHQSGKIDADTKQEWLANENTRKLAAQYGWSDHYEALRAQSNTPRAPQKLLARLTRGYVENVVSAHAIATLRGMDVNEVTSLLDDEGIEPREPVVVWANAAALPDVEIDLSDWIDEQPGNGTE